MGSSAIPTIDPKVKHVGVSKLRLLNASKLRQTDDTFVIQDNDEPIAVLLTYDRFMEIQYLLNSLLNTMELYQDKAELAGVKAGLADVKAGRFRPLADIDAELARKR
jgi:predicted transcriptional regulator